MHMYVCMLFPVHVCACTSAYVPVRVGPWVCLCVWVCMCISVHVFMKFIVAYTIWRQFHCGWSLITIPSDIYSTHVAHDIFNSKH